MKKKFAFKIVLCLCVMTAILLTLFAHFSKKPWEIFIEWKQSIHYLLWFLLFVNIICLYHFTRRGYGEDHSNDFFNFPINFIIAMATLAAIYQIATDSSNIAETRATARAHNSSLSANKIVVSTWENDPMQYPILNTMYENIMGPYEHNGKAEFDSINYWEKQYPNIPYISYEGNELEWHYAAKFCQQMVNLIRMFQLEQSLQFKHHVHSNQNINPFNGWLVCFRMFLKNPLVRNVWEQYKVRHGSPLITAWVKINVLDVIDADKDYFLHHKEKWDQAVKDILQEQKSRPASNNSKVEVHLSRT